MSLDGNSLSLSCKIWFLFDFLLCSMPDAGSQEAVKPSTYGEYCISCCSHKLWFSKEVNSTNVWTRRHWLPKSKVQAFHSSSKKSFEKSNWSACFYETSLSKVLFQSISNAYPITNKYHLLWSSHEASSSSNLLAFWRWNLICEQNNACMMREVQVTKKWDWISFDFP